MAWGSRRAVSSREQLSAVLLGSSRALRSWAEVHGDNDGTGGKWGEMGEDWGNRHISGEIIKLQPPVNGQGRRRNANMQPPEKGEIQAA